MCRASEICYVECRYAECHYAECRGAYVAAASMLLIVSNRAGDRTRDLLVFRLCSRALPPGQLCNIGKLERFNCSQVMK